MRGNTPFFQAITFIEQHILISHVVFHRQYSLNYCKEVLGQKISPWIKTFSPQKVTVTDSNWWMKSEPAEPVFVKLDGAQESIPPCHVAWRACTTNRVVVPVRRGWASIPELLKRFTNTGSSNPPSSGPRQASIIYAALFFN